MFSFLYVHHMYILWYIFIYAYLFQKCQGTYWPGTGLILPLFLMILEMAYMMHYIILYIYILDWHWSIFTVIHIFLYICIHKCIPWSFFRWFSAGNGHTPHTMESRNGSIPIPQYVYARSRSPPSPYLKHFQWRVLKTQKLQETGEKKRARHHG